MVQEIVEGVSTIVLGRVQEEEKTEEEEEIQQQSNNVVGIQDPTLAAVLAQLKQQQNMFQQMIAGNSNNFQTGRDRGRGRSRGGRGRGRQNYAPGGHVTGGGYIRNHHYYCWTHGACGHDGTRCRHPSVGHQENATFQNRMNGNPAYCQ